MRRPRITLRRAALAAFLLLLAAGLTAPYLHADRFHRRIREALESAFRRKVEIEDTRFNLFRGPGFSLRKVVIHEDPVFGIEPFAYVASVEARLRMRSLLAGKLEFSSLRLVDPSVNLVKGRAGPWNFQPLLAQAARAALPEIRVRGGRVNFKIGETKSAVYFMDADLDVDPPPAAGGAFELRFAGEPARTDRVGSGLGRISGRGRWRPSPGAGAALELSLALQKSPLANLSTLVRGYDVGVHGAISGEAKLGGALPDVDVQGRISLEDLHRWDAMPPYAKGGTLRFRGRLDLVSQKLRLDTVSGDASALPLAVRFRAAEYLSRPRWALTAELRQAPLAPLVEIARHMGLPLAEPLAMEGSVNGVIGYAPGSGLRGAVAVSEARVRGPRPEPVEFRQARVVLDGSRLRLSQAAFETERGEVARLEAEYQPQTERLELGLRAAPLRLEALGSGAGPLLGMIPSPIPAQIRGGQLEGLLRYTRTGDVPGEWSGEVRITGASLALPALAEPVSDLSAALRLQDGRVSLRNLRAAAGSMPIEGEYHYRPGARRPHQFACRLAAADAAQLERLLMPALRRRGGLLSRALGFRTPLPAWLRDLHAQGRLEIGSLLLHGLQVENVRGLVFWDSTRLEVAGWEGRLGEAEAAGRLLVDLRGSEPSYEFAGSVKSVAWRTGALGGDVLLRAAGTGPALLSSLRLEGDFTAHGIDLIEGLTVNSATGCFEFGAARGQPRLRLRNIRAVSGMEIFTGEGETSPDGKLVVNLRGDRSQLRLATRVFPLETASAPPR